MHTYKHTNAYTHTHTTGCGPQGPQTDVDDVAVDTVAPDHALRDIVLVPSARVCVCVCVCVCKCVYVYVYVYMCACVLHASVCVEFWAGHMCTCVRAFGMRVSVSSSALVVHHPGVRAVRIIIPLRGECHNSVTTV
jgi:hypothetical protein